MRNIFSRLAAYAAAMASAIILSAGLALAQAVEYTVSIAAADVSPDFGSSTSETYVSSDGGNATVYLWWRNTPLTQSALLSRFTEALNGSGITPSIISYNTNSASNTPNVMVRLGFSALPGSLGERTVRVNGISHTQRIIQVPVQSFKTSGAMWVETRHYWGSSPQEYSSDIEYINGLGLPRQIVNSAASGGGKSIVTPVVYDECLRAQSKSMLPFESSASTGAMVTSASTQSARYSALYGDDAQYAFNRTSFDSFGLGRPVETVAPGRECSDAGKSRSVTYGITTVTDKVFRIEYSSSTRRITIGTSPSPYLRGASMAVTTDEDGNRTAVVTDAQGRTRLSRAYLRNEAGQYSAYADTYTVYDEAGRPVWIISPEGSLQIAPATLIEEEGETARKWCTVYRYDALGRTVGRRLPGCGWEWTVYDRGDRPVLTQDAEQRKDNLWTYMVYDNQGREIERTLVRNITHDRESLQALYDARDNTYPGLGGCADYRVPIAATEFSLVSQLSQSRYGGSQHYRTSTSSASGHAKFSVPSYLGFQSTSGFAVTADRDTTVTNLKVYEKIWAVGEAEVISSLAQNHVERAYYYDRRGRVIQTVERNVFGKTSRTSVKYDLQGHPVAVREDVYMPSGSQGSTVYATRRSWYTYDTRGRMLSDSTLVTGTASMISGARSATVHYCYDALGRRSVVHMGNGLEQSQSYTTQGKVGSIDVANASGGEVFSMELGYYPSSDDAHGLYNGSISRAGWQQGSAAQHSFAFTYDDLGRLLSSQPDGGTGPGETGMSYDLNGNLLGLTRTEDAGAGFNALEFSLVGNRMTGLSVDDGGTPDSYAFAYDDCGRMTSDSRRAITVSYNEIGLPKTVRALEGGAVKARYIYLADGTKLATLAPDGTSTTGLFYLGTMRLSGTPSTASFDSCPFSEGRIVRNSTITAPTYHINDYLGNVRVVADADGTVVERNDYHPFGERMSSEGTFAGTNAFRIGGKEQQSLGGIGWTDFGARMYDPYIARWTAPDPLAGKYPSFTPYGYCADNPVNFVDPDGEDPRHYVKQGWFWIRRHDIAMKIGKYDNSTNNISTQAGNFALIFPKQQVSSMKQKPEQKDEGSMRGAYRHVLWQAAIASEFGTEIATQAGNAHEDNHNIKKVSFQQKKLEKADRIVDLLNNEIGREIGEAYPGRSISDLSLIVLEKFKDVGFFTAYQVEDGRWIITKTKLTDEQYKYYKNKWQSLDKNGRDVNR